MAETGRYERVRVQSGAMRVMAGVLAAAGVGVGMIGGPLTVQAADLSLTQAANPAGIARTLTPPLVLVAPPINTGTTTTLAGELDGVVTYNGFPCVFSCAGGTFSGDGRITVSGIDTEGLPYTAVWLAALTPNFAATFWHQEQCFVDVPYSETTVFGHFTLSGGLVTVTGQPAIYSSATLVGSFGWTREGTTLLVTLDGTVLTATDGSGTTVTVASSTGLVGGVGTGQWAPTNGPGLCGSPVAGQTAEVAGVELLPA